MSALLEALDSATQEDLEQIDLRIDALEKELKRLQSFRAVVWTVLEDRDQSQNEKPTAAEPATTVDVPADFPLWIHPTGQWCKKIKGKFYYFGNSDVQDWQSALNQYNACKDVIEAGRPGERFVRCEKCNRRVKFEEIQNQGGKLACIDCRNNGSEPKPAPSEQANRKAGRQPGSKRCDSCNRFTVHIQLYGKQVVCDECLEKQAATSNFSHAHDTLVRRGNLEAFAERAARGEALFDDDGDEE